MSCYLPSILEDMEKLKYLDDVYVVGSILTEKDGVMLETSRWQLPQAEGAGMAAL